VDIRSYLSTFRKNQMVEQSGLLDPWTWGQWIVPNGR